MHFQFPVVFFASGLSYPPSSLQRMFFYPSMPMAHSLTLFKSVQTSPSPRGLPWPQCLQLHPRTYTYSQSSFPLALFYSTYFITYHITRSLCLLLIFCSPLWPAPTKGAPLSVQSTGTYQASYPIVDIRGGNGLTTKMKKYCEKKKIYLSLTNTQNLKQKVIIYILSFVFTQFGWQKHTFHSFLST